MTLRVLVVVLLSLALAACQSPGSVKTGSIKTPSSVSDLQIAEREAALIALGGFSVSGGLGIWTDEESISARMAWREAAETLSVTLVAPLGLGTLDLYRDINGTTVKRGNALIGAGHSADHVLQQALSLERPVPLEQMSAWLMGLPGAGRQIQRDDRGRIKTLNYRDSDGINWHAQFLKYTKQDGFEVPALIFAKGGPYNVRLKLQNWVLASEAETEGTDVTPKGPTNNIKSPQRLAIPGQ